MKRQPFRPGFAPIKQAVAHHAGLILLAAALLFYLLTLDTGLQPHELHGGDLITHQYAQVQARPSNAPGYPLYTMGGWLWFHGGRALAQLTGAAQPNPVPILSSYSTLWALLALWLFYRILCHLTRTSTRPHGNRAVAGLLGAFYAVTYFFWYYATTTEQYSSAVAQTLAIVYVYLLWREAINQRRTTVHEVGASSANDERRTTNDERPTTRQQPAASSQQPTATRLLLLLAFLCGLSLAHMLTVAFIVPPLVLLVLWDAPGMLRRPQLAAGAILAAALPLLGYVYVYARGAAHPEWWGRGDWRTAGEWFWAFVSTAQGRKELGWGLEPGRAFWGGGFPEMMWSELSLPLFMLGLIGIAWLGWRLAFLLYSTLAIYFVFCWAYRYGNWFQVILPAYPLILLGVAKLIDNCQFAIVNCQLSITPPTRRLLALTPLLLLVLAIVWRVDASLPAVDSRNRPGDTALDRAALLLDQPLPPGAALFAAVDDALALQYLSDVWRIRPDMRVIDRRQAARHLADGAPVYVTVAAAARLYSELPPELDVTVQGVSPDWMVLRIPDAPPTVDAPHPDVPLHQSVTPGVTLLGYTVQPGPTGAPVTDAAPSLDVLLYWQLAEGAWPPGLSTSVRPTQQGAFIPAAEGKGVIQRDAAHPLHGLLDLTAPEGTDDSTIVVDAYRLPLAGAEADGLAVIMYRVTDTGFENVAEVRGPLW